MILQTNHYCLNSIAFCFFGDETLVTSYRNIGHSTERVDIGKQIDILTGLERLGLVCCQWLKLQL